jgi:hypothetical protein
MKKLHLHPKCTQYFHELLDMIQEDMIVVRARDRISSGQLHRKLSVLDEKLRQDEEYCMSAYSRSWLAKPQLPFDARPKPQYNVNFDGNVSIQASNTHLPIVDDDDTSGTRSSWVNYTPSSGLNDQAQQSTRAEVTQNQSRNLHQPEENLMPLRVKKSPSADIKGLGDLFGTIRSPSSHSFSSDVQHSSPSKSPMRVKAVKESSMIRPQEDIVTILNWRSIWGQLPTSLQNVIEFERVSGGMPCWTCVPEEPELMVHIPLTIASAPVVIPVMYQIPIRGGVAPPKDPFPEAISPCTPISDTTAGAIFEQYPAAIGFYLLRNGFLQLLVPSDFDLGDAYDDLPIRFGGLKVSYVREDAYPRATHNSQTTPVPNLAPIRVRSFAVAKPEVPRGEAKTKRAKMGVKTRANNQTYMTVSTHLITKALVGNKVGVSLDNFNKVQIFSDSGLRVSVEYLDCVELPADLFTRSVQSIIVSTMTPSYPISRTL